MSTNHELKVSLTGDLLKDEEIVKDTTQKIIDAFSADNIGVSYGNFLGTRYAVFNFTS